MNINARWWHILKDAADTTRVFLYVTSVCMSSEEAQPVPTTFNEAAGTARDVGLALMIKVYPLELHTDYEQTNFHCNLIANTYSAVSR
jgi:hypothetical protein